LKKNFKHSLEEER